MPCLGARKKSTLSSSNSITTQEKGINRAASTVSHHTLTATTKLKQENTELRNKNLESVEIIAKLSSEVEQLKKQLTVASLSVKEEQGNDNNEAELLQLKTQNEEIAARLMKKETELEESTLQIQKLLITSQNNSEGEENCEGQVMQLLEEKDRLLEEKCSEIEELKLQWETERAELIKPALNQVNLQLEELKETNKLAAERLAEKEDELAELRSELTRRDRKPKQSFTKDQENQRRLNRLTVDLENDRLLIQKLDELNQQLESQKKKHESTLEAHAKVIAEKDKTLLQQQKSLKQLKIVHENATKSLEQEQIHNMRKLQLKHERDMEVLTKRLKLAENQAKSNVNDELDQILVEFEQSQHNHSVEVADLQKSYQEQISFMKRGQQAELQNLISAANSKKNEDAGNRRPSVSKLRDSKFTWPPTVATPITS